MTTAPRLVAAMAALAFMGGAAIRAQAPQGLPPDPASITTTGEAMASVAPDVAYVQIATEGRAKKTADAQRISADAMASLRTALKAVALAPNAIRTTGYSVSEEYDRVGGEQTFRDYLARNSIDVRVDDLKLVPAVIDTAGGVGAVTVSGLRFDLKDRATVERDLLRRAVEDAMSRADAIAAGAHRTVGSIIRIQEQRFLSPAASAAPFGMSAGRGGGSTPIEPGEVQVRASITLTVAIR